MHSTLDAFVATYAGHDRGAFVEAVPWPHLLLDGDLPLREGCGAGTVRLRGPAVSRLDRAPERLIVAVRRREGADRVPGVITLGRAPNSDIVLSDGSLSRLQAYFWRRGRGWRVGDLDSANGTSVDGQRVPRHGSLPLRTGARLVFAGSLAASFVEPEELHVLVRDLALERLLEGERCA